MSTTSHQTVSQHQGHSLEGRGRISSQLTKAGHRRTDGRTGKISLVSPWALHASGKTLPPPFSRAPLLFFCLFNHRAHAITDKVIQVNVKIPYLLISVSCPTVCFETEAQDLRPMSCIGYILQCQFPTQLDTVLVAHPLAALCFSCAPSAS